MKNKIVRTPVLDVDGQVLLPTGTVLNDEVLWSVAIKGVDYIDTWSGPLRIEYPRNGADYAIVY